METHFMSPPPEPSYSIEAKNKFFTANRQIVEYELRPGHTVTFLSEVDLTEIERLRAAAGAQKPSYTAFVVKAVAIALRSFPYANRRVCRRAWLPFGRRRLQRFEQVDVAVACEREVPGAEGVAFADVLRQADEQSLADITAWLRDLSTADESTNSQWRAYSSTVRRLPNWLSAWLVRLPYFLPGFWVKFRGGPVLISSPAKYGVDAVIATWSWPLGVSFGLVKSRPLVRDGVVVPCPTFTLTLNFDRRVMAGAQAGRFFHRIVVALESADTEMSDYLRPSTANATEHEVKKNEATD
jgi:pyruvate/2-oxoglutarate dehydrogenase complex dihydrolipoamide acyltransferase (E2) component